MAIIKAPFNFVPLADKVYIPYWADQISQDVPFSDGVSGYIDLNITAKSPIFIRNGHTKEEADAGKEAVKKAIEEAKKTGRGNPDFTLAKQLPYNSFSKSPDGHYFIPATSIKGEVRSILEIMTFSKMRVDKSVKFAQREWYNESLYPKQVIQKELLCGYLKWYSKDGKYKIESHGKPLRISHKKIDAFLKALRVGENIFESHFSKNSDFNLNKSHKENGITYDPKTARYKYHLIGAEDCLLDVSFCIDDTSDNSSRLMYSPDGNIIGDIILTGQPGKWVFPRPNKERFKEQHSNLSGKKLDEEFMKEVQRAGKFYEFVFPQQTEGKPIEMDEIEFNYFKFIYSESEEWARVKELLMNNSKGIPVFFRKEEKKDKDGNSIVVIKDFGLAYMYKLPYENSPYDILEKMYTSYGEHLDMAECMFGAIASQKGNDSATKGRIHFSNCVSQSAEEFNPQTIVLNSPKASYYPIYIKQEGVGGIVSLNSYHTYNDGNLSGWKRYVVRNNTNEGIWTNNTGDPKIDTTIFPLKPETEFKGKIFFHNLRPVELGALLSALTFHSTEECYHSLGQGKPYGFGKTKYSIELHCNERKEDMEYFMALFERTISKTLGVWRDSATIRSLFTLSGKEVAANSENYKYMKLSVNPTINDFQSAKVNKKATEDNDGHKPEYLQDFVSLQGIGSSTPNPLEPYALSIEEKAQLLKEQMKDYYNQTIAEYSVKISKDCFGDAAQILQSAKIFLNNPPEPLVAKEMADLIEGIKSKEIELYSKREEKKYNKCKSIYEDALSVNSSDALSIIEKAISELEICEIQDATRWIDELKEKEGKIKKGSSPISEFLSTFSLASINAFANQIINKRHRITPISIEDIPFITKKIKEEWENLKASERKVWLDRKKWGQLEKGLGVELTNAIFDGIKDLPIK